jgi:sterol desaturase/sphingolipid hydroxylase (fatty acid hydroxylase superfamily)
MHRKLNLPDLFLAISLVMIALEAALGSLAVIKARYQARDALASLGMQVGNIAMNLMMAGVVYAGLTAAYGVRLFDISPASPWAWIAIFFLDDFTYYWFHRISHECRFWWAAHVNHHSSQQYNLSTAVRQSWTSVIVGTWTPWIPLAFLGFPPAMILAQQGFNLFYQFWIHTEVVRRMPAWFEYLFNTPSHHRVHHASNPRYLDRNYAGVLMIWDRLFGTFVAERDEEPACYGIVKNIETYNPIRIAFHEWISILRDVWAARSWREALAVVFAAPGWRPDGRGLTSKNIRSEWNLRNLARR